MKYFLRILSPDYNVRENILIALKSFKRDLINHQQEIGFKHTGRIIDLLYLPEDEVQELERVLSFIKRTTPSSVSTIFHPVKSRMSLWTKTMRIASKIWDSMGESVDFFYEYIGSMRK